MLLLFALPVGLAIGAISGFFGVGGGFLLTPLLLLLGYPPTTAITISLLYSMSTSISGALTYIQSKNILLKTAVFLALSGMIGTQLAKPVILYLTENGLDDAVISILYLFLLGYFAISMFLKAPNTEGTNVTSTISPLQTILIGLLGGFISSILGVGGGFVMVPLLINVLHLPARLAVGTSLTSIFFIVSTGFFSYIQTVTIPLTLAILLVSGALFGARFGAKITASFSEEMIKKLLATLYLFTLMSILFKLLHHATSGLLLLVGYIVTLIILFLYQYWTKKKRLFFFE
ncbi:sulfite exporter TauE/SafE family protein [Bacillus sp. RAR_GA_16]|uniref:sulfite exporter TauE/SafE family protein n=1 Tax=Bacillus sp. RAR_GA_16 TaxID=2876774 RepID=UPI001CCBF210|nr:sulfite exporter TauE/SafE family protein [Bacillus sp. RAR_GA_16]MCA0172767.1 sulfite exporter TauE/SafE family protein [Bacillus sp. RAR_GA_16]